MTVKQALKQKNLLVKKINEDIRKVHAYNSVDEGNTRPYSTKELFNKIIETTKELVDLKTRIHLANGPVYHKIFELSELKNQVKYLKTLNCISGKVSTSRWGSETEPTIKHAEINVVERDKMVKNLESRIEFLQDELDRWNHDTLID